PGQARDRRRSSRTRAGRGSGGPMPGRLGRAAVPGPAGGAGGRGGGTRTKVTAVVGVAGPAGTTAVRVITSATATAAGLQVGPHTAPSPSSAAGPGSAASPGGAASPGTTASSGTAERLGTAAAPNAEAAPDPAAAQDAPGGSGEPIPVGGVAGLARSCWPAGPGLPGRDAQDSAYQDSAYQEGDHQYGQQGNDDGADPPTGGDPGAGTASLLALRDDGAAARWAGRIVQGNLIPLPPALAGLIATAMLAALGLRDLRGFIAMTPPIVMMLAAPGSSHPHDGRFDWLVPALLALAQYVYLGALGFAVSVPGPVIFAACALTALWYAGLAAGGAGPRETGPRGAGSGVGWEVRLFLAGLAVTFGLGTFGYVGLAAYLGVLLCRPAADRYLTRMEDDRT
ncbi:MAG TPA: hypothetical protein VF843_05210, partial [Streptosporangiaceae bacterium]